jgi:hypothetical protein
MSSSVLEELRAKNPWLKYKRTPTKPNKEAKEVMHRFVVESVVKRRHPTEVRDSELEIEYAKRLALDYQQNVAETNPDNELL